MIEIIPAQENLNEFTALAREYTDMIRRQTILSFWPEQVLTAFCPENLPIHCDLRILLRGLII